MIKSIISIKKNVKKVKNLFIFVLLVNFSACSPAPSVPSNRTIDLRSPSSEPLTTVAPVLFEANGIAFNLPKGWQMTDTVLASAGYYIAAERIGNAESGMFTLSRIDDPNLSLKEIMAQRTPRGAKAQKGVFRGYNCFLVAFVNENMGIKINKTIYVFEACDAKYVVSCVSESTNDVQNNADFGEIIASWQCR